MPDLKWNETDVIECLEVLPEVDNAYKTQHIFEVIQPGLRLRLTIERLEQQARFELYSAADGLLIIAFRVVIRGAIKYVKEGHVEQLEFTDCIIGPSNGWWHESDAYSTKANPTALTVILSIKPAIRIQIQEYQRWPE